MAMAIHSAKLAAEKYNTFSRKRINRSTLENNYLNDWNRNFKNRLQAGRLLGNYYNMKKKRKLSLKFNIFLLYYL
jgi:hypothetical protein